MLTSSLLAKVRRKNGALSEPLFLTAFRLVFPFNLTFRFSVFLYACALFGFSLILASALTSNPALAQGSATQNKPAIQDNSAALVSQLEQMQEEIRNLRNQVETQAHLIEKLEQDQKNRYLDLDERAQEHSKRLNHLEALPKPASLKPASSAQSSAASKQPPSTTQKGSQEQQAYNLAYSKIPEQQFDAAVKDFQEFIKNYPNSKLVGNAYYWIGEVYMAQKRTNEAEKMFQVVVKQHPESFKLADSKYKLGLIQVRYGKDEQAKKIMQEIIQQHPREPAANLARNFLKSKQ